MAIHSRDNEFVIKLIGVTQTCMEKMDWNWNKNDVVFDNVKKKIIFATKI
jgi:hypothetical protein